MYLVVNICAIYVTAYYQINKPYGNTKSIIICAIKNYTGVSHKFPSITKTAEVLKVTIYYFSRCVREGKNCKGYIVIRKKQEGS